MSYRDQAFKLRKLVSARTRPRILPRLLVVGSGMRAVGCSTTSLQLAVTMARLGRRVALIDGELSRPRLAAHCGLAPTHGLTDILLARRGIHEVIVPGPDGMQLVAGGQAPDGQAIWSSSAHQRLLEQLGELQRHVDLVIFHAGPQMRGLHAPIWSATDMLLLVTSADSDSIMNAYSALKHLRDSIKQLPQARTVVTGAPTEDVAQDVHHRLQASCQRFLGLAIAAGGSLPAMTPESNPLATDRLHVAGLDQTMSRIAAELAEALDSLGEKRGLRAA